MKGSLTQPLLATLRRPISIGPHGAAIIVPPSGRTQGSPNPRLPPASKSWERRGDAEEQEEAAGEGRTAKVAVLEVPALVSKKCSEGLGKFSCRFHCWLVKPVIDGAGERQRDRKSNSCCKAEKGQGRMVPWAGFSQPTGHREGLTGKGRSDLDLQG